MLSDVIGLRSLYFFNMTISVKRYVIYVKVLDNFEESRLFVT